MGKCRWWRKQSIGAIISVKGLTDSDIGKNVTLTHNGEIVDSKTVPEDKIVDFTDIMNTGEYVIKCEGYTKDRITTVTIEDVFAKNIIIVSYIILVLGSIYKLADCEWMAVTKDDTHTTLIMTKGNTTKGNMSGKWPGYVHNGNKNYASNYYDNFMADSNCQTAYPGLKVVYDEIKSVQYGDRGFYLFSNVDCNQTASGRLGSGYYVQASKTASINYKSFDTEDISSNGVWLGTLSDPYAWYVTYDGYLYAQIQANPCIVASAFNIDTSKIYLDGDMIKIR